MARRWSADRGSRLVGALAAVVFLAACGSTKTVTAPSSLPHQSPTSGPASAGGPPSPPAATSAGIPPSPSVLRAPASVPPPSPVAVRTGPAASSPPPGGSGSGCTLAVIESVAGESSTDDDAKSQGWAPIRANGWTAFVPGGNWIITASDAGADIMSPDGQSDSSLEEWDAQTPWTVEGLQNKLLAPVSNLRTICSAGAETAGNTHAMEFTGTFRGEAIHGVILVSLLAQTNATLYQAQTRSMYSPAAAWTAAEETTLMVISKRAIQSPNSLPIPQG